ncbi:MAG: hypothetical protein H6670_15700 [Anaerolineaceae bacterium]|nr:hypothetical protein [Anaerolineaceae bacterium]
MGSEPKVNDMDNTPKKSYTKPILTKHGLVKDLVKGSTSRRNDMGGSQNGGKS